MIAPSRAQEARRLDERGALPASHLRDLGKNVGEVVVDVSGDHADDVRVHEST